MEEPGRLQSMGSLRVGHNWATSLSLFTFMHWRRKWQSTPVFLPGESQGRGSLVGCGLWLAQSRTRLKWLSSSSTAIHTLLLYLSYSPSLLPIKVFPFGNSLVVQWLGICTPNTGFTGSILGWGTRSHMPQPKIWCAATKTRAAR